MVCSLHFVLSKKGLWWENVPPNDIVSVWGVFCGYVSRLYSASGVLYPFFDDEIVSFWGESGTNL